MLVTLAILIVFQCMGEGIAHAFLLSIPGPVIGMVLLFIALLLSPRLMELVEQSSHRILKHMSLFFVPAGVGIMVSVSGVIQHWFALVVAIMVSTLLCLVVTALTMRFFFHTQPEQASHPIEPSVNSTHKDRSSL
ncbi:CidA/LrgA family protein [Undibacterium fentianense]|uniref:CidA/LrgA family protein n=1 Tax=Undibacterium fentianense TaxID=2828728 RepID=A0A941E376_9BURK|nr:CidA/LrgA family protein [Undibacterium fentianense]MBR7799799.1 CidA/LrgA family protein [Undibacterium fentianense]